MSLLFFFFFLCPTLLLPLLSIPSKNSTEAPHRDDDDGLWIPHPRRLPEFFLENPESSGAADVVRHQFVDLGPDVVSRAHGAGRGGGAGGRVGVDVVGEDLLGHRHGALDLFFFTGRRRGREGRGFHETGKRKNE